MAEQTPRWATPLIFNDEPVGPGETAYFQFQAYADTLARLIAARTTRTPLTVGVFGEWGTGKTTLLRAIQARLDETRMLEQEDLRISFLTPVERGDYRRCRTVWFNAWKYGHEKEILVALVEAILRQMRDDGFIHELYATLAKPTGPHLRVVDATLSIASQLLSGGKVDIDLSKFRVESQLRENLPFLDEFQRVFDQLLVWYVRRKVKDRLNLKEIESEEERLKLDQEGVLAIFIDDLDRCLPARTVQVLEAIKLMIGRPGTAFVLGASERAVQEAIRVHYKEQEKTLAADHQQYLEKLIQVRFELPPLRPADVQQFVEGLHRDLSLDETLRQNLPLVAVGVPTNPRRIKTFINYVELEWALLFNSGQAEGRLDRAVLTRWLVLDAAERSFTDYVRQLPSAERPEFVQNARLLARGEKVATSAPYKQWPKERHPRLWNVLKHDSFAFDVGPEVVDLLIYLSAPPVQAPAEAEAPAPPPQREAARPLRERAEKGPVRLEAAETLLPALVEVPAGPFLMGSLPDNPLAARDEKPQFSLELPAYLIGRYPVTVAEFARFVEAGGYQDKALWIQAGWRWKEKEQRTGLERYRDPFDRPDHPAVGVSWYEAVAYCRWLTEQLPDLELGVWIKSLADGDLKSAIQNRKFVVRLPTEAEWEKAARGEHGREWPWGDEFDPARANTREGGPGHTTPVGQYSPAGDSPYGCADVAGNVWQWCQSLYEPYPYQADDGREDLEAGGARVLRGGAFFRDGRRVRCASRYGLGPYRWSDDLGFRVVVAPGLFSGL